jgi:hypothetical protein
MHTRILNGLEARGWLSNCVGKNTLAIDLCSAYMKLSSLDYFISLFRRNGFNGRVRLLARWKPGDLNSGASDIEVFDYCQSHDIEFFIKQDFHGKLYQIVPEGILIGSFNLTGSGFSLFDSSNDEAGVPIDCSIENTEYVEKLFQSAKKVDSNLYKKICEFIALSANKPIFDIEWPNDIGALLEVVDRNNRFLVNEFFYKNYDLEPHTNEDLDLLHDLSLLGLDIKDLKDKNLVSLKLKRTSPYRWVRKSLFDAGGELYFGALSVKLHNCLLDDPRPYRKDVKKLLENLFSWIGCFDHEILIDRPNHSQRIRLLT